ncbi:MAG: hypothetical protein WCS43_14495 [Verrucomicrobiota bacterium]
MTPKELRQSLRRGSFVLPFLAIQALALMAMIAEFQIGSASGGSESSGMLNVWLLVSSGPFWMIVGTICMILMPLGGLVLMGQELEEGNHELLLLTKLNRWKVVVGKFMTLWGLSAITFVSLLPYVVVRYLVGGVEWWHEAACATTVLGVSAMVGAGAIGASAFQSIGARIAVFFLFIGSMVAGCGAALAGSAMVTGGCGVFYHFTAVMAVLCFTMIGLSLARSRLRLAVMAYEIKPGGMMVGVVIFAPFVIGLLSAMTCGFGGFLGLVIMGLVAARIDSSRKAPVQVPLPPIVY